MRKVKKDVMDFTKVGVGLGVGTAIIAGTGHGASVLPAFSVAGSMMKPLGVGMMGMHTLRLVDKGYKPYTKKKRK